MRLQTSSCWQALSRGELLRWWHWNSNGIFWVIVILVSQSFVSIYVFAKVSIDFPCFV